MVLSRPEPALSSTFSPCSTKSNSRRRSTRDRSIFSAWCQSKRSMVLNVPRQAKPVGLPMPEEALHHYFNEMQKRTALRLYGRNMYEVMKYWDAPPAESSEVEHEFARVWQRTPKVVFSTTLESVGPNARLVKDKADTERTVRHLKVETNGEIEVSGAALAASLVCFGLVETSSACT